MKDGRTATCTMTVCYAWRQKRIRLFLFGQTCPGAEIIGRMLP